MNPRSGGPRSFNTVKRSNRQERLTRRRQGRMTLVAIVAVLLLLALSGVILLVCNIVTAVQARNPAGTQPPVSTGEPSTSIQYQTVTMTYQETQAGDLILVNQNHAYAFPAVRLEQMDSQMRAAYDMAQYRQAVGALAPYQLSPLHTHTLLQPAAAQSLNAMLTQFYTLSGDSRVTVYESYRSADDQQSSGSSIAPGCSEHHTALVVRLCSLVAPKSYADINEIDYAWIYENAHLYGFIQRYPTTKVSITGVSNCPEYFRYVGTAHATYIRQNSLCLEQYLEQLRLNHATKTGAEGLPLSVDTNGDGNADYRVYYVVANTGANTVTPVPVPSNYAYTVSGDNCGGFVVTVDLNAPRNA